MDTTELKGLCILAYEKQIAALAAAEGDKGKLMSELKLEIKEVGTCYFEKHLLSFSFSISFSISRFNCDYFTFCFSALFSSIFMRTIGSHNAQCNRKEYSNRTVLLFTIIIIFSNFRSKPCQRIKLKKRLRNILRVQNRKNAKRRRE